MNAQVMRSTLGILLVGVLAVVAGTVLVSRWTRQARDAVVPEVPASRSGAVANGEIAAQPQPEFENFPTATGWRTVHQGMAGHHECVTDRSGRYQGNPKATCTYSPKDRPWPPAVTEPWHSPTPLPEQPPDIDPASAL